MLVRGQTLDRLTKCVNDSVLALLWLIVSASWVPTSPELGCRSCSSFDKSLSSSVSKDSIVSSKNRRQAFSSAERWSRLSSLCDAVKKGSENSFLGPWKIQRIFDLGSVVGCQNGELIFIQEPIYWAHFTAFEHKQLNSQSHGHTQVAPPTQVK